jgi:Nuclease-related domain
VNYTRLQQYRRLSRAATAAAASGASVLLALAVAAAGAVSAAGAILVLAVGLGLYARHWLSLAGRSRVGARSEDEVRRALRTLEDEGWRVRHSLRWRGVGDVDSVAIAPGRVAFAIETKTRTYGKHHLRVVSDQAAWLCRRRRRWCRCGALPVLCIARAHGVERWERGVLIVSLDRIVPALRYLRGSGTPGVRG